MSPAPSTTRVKRSSTVGPSILPLTTVFTPPGDCATAFPLPSDLQTFDDTTILTLGASSVCYPKGYSTVSYYSPGVCPSDWELVKADKTSVNTWTETHGICCPLDIHTPDSNLDFDKYSTRCALVLNLDTTSEVIYADLVSIAWQSTDFTTPTTTPTAASTSIQLAESSSTNTSTSTMTETPTSAPKAHSGLSAGAQAGIGVGVSIGVLSVVAIAFGIFFIRRKRRAELPQDTSFPADDDPPAELPHDGKSGRPLSELPTPAFFTPELPGSEVSQGGSNLSKSEGPTGPAELGPIL